MKTIPRGSQFVRLTRRTGLVVVACILGSLGGAPAQSTAAVPNFERSRDEIVRILAGFVQVDTTDEGGKVKYLEVATAEKVPWPGFVYAKGTSGHGSRPLVDNAIVHLANAVSELAAWQPPLRLNETTREYLSRRVLLSPPESGFLYEHVEHPALSRAVQEKLRIPTRPRTSARFWSSAPPQRRTFSGALDF